MNRVELSAKDTRRTLQKQAALKLVQLSRQLADTVESVPKPYGDITVNALAGTIDDCARRALSEAQSLVEYLVNERGQKCKCAHN